MPAQVLTRRFCCPGLDCIAKNWATLIHILCYSYLLFLKEHSSILKNVLSESIEVIQTHKPIEMYNWREGGPLTLDASKANSFYNEIYFLFLTWFSFFFDESSNRSFLSVFQCVKQYCHKTTEELQSVMFWVHRYKIWVNASFVNLREHLYPFALLIGCCT